MDSPGRFSPWMCPFCQTCGEAHVLLTQTEAGTGVDVRGQSWRRQPPGARARSKREVAMRAHSLTVAQPSAAADKARLARRRRMTNPGLTAYVRGGDVATFMTAPVIYSLLIPFILLDLWVSLYQWICFPVYGMAHVPRRRYFVFDRQALSYLNALEKVNCIFCGYANGVVAYVREVGARTEQYWCPIKHSRPLHHAHDRYDQFFAFGDAEGYRRGLKSLRAQLKKREDARRG